MNTLHHFVNLCLIQRKRENIWCTILKVIKFKKNYKNHVVKIRDIDIKKGVTYIIETEDKVIPPPIVKRYSLYDEQ